ncbi:hypothetical protein JOC77_001016 [Peribacillus deserti]|uniref:Uncharacterized protein n=1 Tax=Peribacillus deserti TaxID=673318 RepID=A0ABS2QG00_9BACI|nr:hypothetical protein [Peribacillus deserti]MBM7691609.1 hypothetical protein [Peribacillus deserti]
MKKVIGYGAGIILLTLLAATLLGVDVPLPTSYVWLILFVNSLFALFSIFLPKMILYLYELNAFEEKDSVSTYFFKVIALAFSGLNYYAQNAIYRLPFVFSRLLSIAFFAFLLWQMILLTMVLA